MEDEEFPFVGKVTHVRILREDASKRLALSAHFGVINIYSTQVRIVFYSITLDLMVQYRGGREAADKVYSGHLKRHIL
jgi:hypothetical protein